MVQLVGDPIALPLGEVTHESSFALPWLAGSGADHVLE